MSRAAQRIFPKFRLLRPRGRFIIATLLELRSLKHIRKTVKLKSAALPRENHGVISAILP